MKLHKILPIIFFMIAMMISCSQETVINENISGEATTPDTKICVNIKTENSRTVRPEITKWEITVTNKSDANLKFSRTIDGKATSATFVNITDGEYDITVRGFNKDNKIILKNGSNSFYIKPNTVNVCEIIPEDYFPNPIINNDGTFSTPAGNLSIQISGLKDLFTEGEILLLTYTKLPETNNESDTTCDLIFSEEGKISGVIPEIPVGSYKIEISNSKNLNLVKDPVVNIYDNTTTDINWEWNYDSDKIKADQELKGIKIPVWNKSATGDNQLSNGEYGAEYIPARNGYLTANALFAEPIWDEEKTYPFTVTVQAPTGGEPYSANIPASELEFINCTYDDGDLWVLSGTSDSKYFSGEDSSVSEWRYCYCYVLKNVSSSENEEYRFTCSEKILKDFAVATVGEQNKQKYLFYITESDGYNIKSFKIEGEGGDLDEGTPYCRYGGDQYITAIYAKDNNLYIAVTKTDAHTEVNINTGIIINEKGELASFGEDNQLESILSLGISDFTDGTIQNSDFYNSAFMITDMYINEDKSKLYVTAGCVNYNYKSWYYDDSSDGGKYHSFGGLFEYELSIEDNKITCPNSDEPAKYGVYNGDNVNSPFLTNTTNPDDGSQAISLETHIIQATNADSKYFAGPRYIIPSGNDLLIVDSGFYGVYTTPNDNLPLINCEKRNRIFTFDPNAKEKLSLTTLDDSISFDYDYLTSSL